MGTTASVLLFLPEGAVVGHVGDSRAYRLRDDIDPCWIGDLGFDR